MIPASRHISIFCLSLRCLELEQCHTHEPGSQAWLKQTISSSRPIVFDNELSDIPQGNITYRWFKCAGLGSGAGLVAKELGSNPSLSLSGLQGSYINCEVTLTVNGKSKTFVPKAICNGKVSDGIYVRPRIG